jgi:hypothetical protein
MSRTLGVVVSSQASAICAGVWPSRVATACRLGVGEHRVGLAESGAERGERDEGDFMRVAFEEDRQRRMVNHVEWVLHAYDLGALQRVQQVCSGDVAQPYACDEPVLARGDHRAELIVKALIRHRVRGPGDHRRAAG